MSQLTCVVFSSSVELSASLREVGHLEVVDHVSMLGSLADVIHRQAPQLLIGHSLGGAATLAAASRIPEARAVVTIAAPSDTEHLSSRLRDMAPELGSAGEATVRLAGRPFLVRQQFQGFIVGRDRLVQGA